MAILHPWLFCENLCHLWLAQSGSVKIANVAKRKSFVVKELPKVAVIDIAGKINGLLPMGLAKRMKGYACDQC